jgi:hypothetical protein
MGGTSTPLQPSRDIAAISSGGPLREALRRMDADTDSATVQVVMAGVPWADEPQRR